MIKSHSPWWVVILIVAVLFASAAAMAILIGRSHSAYYRNRPTFSVPSNMTNLNENDALAAAGLLLQKMNLDTNDWLPRVDDRAKLGERYLVRNLKDSNRGFVHFANRDGVKAITVELSPGSQITATLQKTK
jgi:hypothetical protein